MKNQTYLLLAFFLALALVPISSAQSFVFNTSQTIDLKIPCFDIQNNYCNMNTVCSLMIFYPNMSVFANGNMTYNYGYFNYTFYTGTTDGLYYCTASCVGNTTAFTTFTMDISANQLVLTSGKSILYILIFIVSFLIFLGLLLLGIALPSKNQSDELTGYILAVSNLKYFKMLCLALSYLAAMFICFFTYNVSLAFLDMPFLTSIFQFAFYVLAVAALPLFIVGVYFVIANWIRDTKVSELLSRGLKVRG